jgi:hypothetical protein
VEGVREALFSLLEKLSSLASIGLAEVGLLRVGFLQVGFLQVETVPMKLGFCAHVGLVNARAISRMKM